MLAKTFSPSELITQDPSFGFPLFGPSRILGLSIATLERFHRDYAAMVDKSTRARIARDLGYEVGLGQATTLLSLHAFASPSEHLQAGSSLRSLTGYCHECILTIETTPEGGLISFTGNWTETFESTLFIRAAQRKTQAPSPIPVCLAMCGILSGYASAVFGEEIEVRESNCQAMGAPSCCFEGRPIAAWPGGKGVTPSDGPRGNTLKNNIIKIQEKLKTKAPNPKATPTLICQAASFQSALDRTDKVAPTDATVLILGESGTGKEVVARRIHNRSQRNQAPFLAINCAALSPELLESELFGHVRGSFTGAEKNKKGLFVQAGEGTLFLDEIGDMPLPIQGKLLRAVQEREVRPVGGLDDIPVKARIVAATNRNLAEMAREGAFRQDLYYRLSVFPITLPPLMERQEDILPLAHAALQKRKPGHPGFTSDAHDVLMRHPWPGNVRELENWVEHALILADQAPIQPEHFPEPVPSAPQAMASPPLDGDLPSLEELSRRYMEKVLHHTLDNKKEAARILGIGTATLWRHLKKQRSQK